VTKFNYGLDFKTTDFRKQPELYRVGIGEQGVLVVEPYKSEILPNWRFRTPDIARLSAEKIYELYEGYKAQQDFVGMDMARKFLQMGWTRSLRYFNHKSGQKYVGAVPTNRKGQSGAHGREVAPFDRDYSKLESAKAFKAKLNTVKTDPVYLKRMKQHQEMFDSQFDTKKDEKRERNSAARSTQGK